MNGTKDTSSRVALPKLFLWNEPTRFQEYPQALARAESGRVYTRQEIEREIFDITPTLTYKRDGKPRGRGVDGIVNAMGFERYGNRYCINGLNLIRKTDNRFIPTGTGLKLGRLYRESRNDIDWLSFLARQILLREPRTRLVIALVLRGWNLRVPVSNNIPSGRLSLVSPNEIILNITSKGCHRFNELLEEYADIALGPLWLEELKTERLTFPFTWSGVLADKPSVHDLLSALKKSLGLLFYLKLFMGHTNSWVMDLRRTGELLGIDVLNSFGLEISSSPIGLSEDECFVRALQESVDEQGYVIASRLADKFGSYRRIPPEERFDLLDRFVRQVMYEDRLAIIAYHRGQPRMGRGLFGDSNYRRLKIDFTSSDNRGGINLNIKKENLREDM